MNENVNPGTRSVSIPKSLLSSLKVTVRGTSPLVTNQFSQRAKDAIQDKQGQKAKKMRGARDPELEFEQSKYLLSNGECGFPVGAIARAFQSASVDVMPRNKSKIARNVRFFGNGYSDEGIELIQICGAKPKMRTDMVRLAGASRTADLRYRAGFDPGWEAEFEIQWSEEAYTLDQMMQLINIAGQSIGICEGRPENSISLGWGTFRVTDAQFTPGAKFNFEEAE